MRKYLSLTRILLVSIIVASNGIYLFHGYIIGEVVLSIGFLLISSLLVFIPIVEKKLVAGICHFSRGSGGSKGLQSGGSSCTGKGGLGELNEAGPESREDKIERLSREKREIRRLIREVRFKTLKLRLENIGMRLMGCWILITARIYEILLILIWLYGLVEKIFKRVRDKDIVGIKRDVVETLELMLMLRVVRVVLEMMGPMREVERSKQWVRVRKMVLSLRGCWAGILILLSMRIILRITKLLNVEEMGGIGKVIMISVSVVLMGNIMVNILDAILDFRYILRRIREEGKIGGFGKKIVGRMFKINMGIMGIYVLLKGLVEIKVGLLSILITVTGLLLISVFVNKGKGNITLSMLPFGSSGSGSGIFRRIGDMVRGSSTQGSRSTQEVRSGSEQLPGEGALHGVGLGEVSGKVVMEKSRVEELIKSEKKLEELKVELDEWK